MADLDELVAQGLAQHQAGKLMEAQSFYWQALKLSPRHAETNHLLGLLAMGVGQAEAACSFFQTALESAPERWDILNNLGAALQRLQRHEEAEQAFRRAMALNEGEPGIAVNLAASLADQEKLNQALVCLERFEAAHSPNAEIMTARAILLARLERADEARPLLKEILARFPDHAQAWFALGNALALQKRLKEAAECFEKMAALDPRHIEARCNLGSTLLDLGRTGEAAQWLASAHALAPDHAGARWNLALALLRQGSWPEAWPHFEARLERPGALKPPREIESWNGKPFAGTLLIQAEQGVGDAIHFARWLPWARERCRRLIVQIHPSLTRLFKASFPDLDILSLDGETPPADRAIALLSLAGLAGALPHLPGGLSPPYLKAPAPRSFSGAALKVGLVWSGNPAHGADWRRSPGLKALPPLLAVEAVEFHALQVGGGDPPPPGMVDHAPELADFADTADVIAALDLVISPDTAVAHLAGAMGRPVWTLLPLAGDWRWLEAGESCLWYPSMTLLRQEKASDWSHPVTLAAERLSRLAAGRKSP